MSLRALFLSVLALVVLPLATPANASIITYTATNTGGTQWRYDYVVTAEAGEAPLDEFTIFFDPPFVASAALRELTLAAGWDGLIQQVDDLLPDHGLIDVFALGSGISAGTSLGGFSVSFDWFGPGAPGSQAFDIIDASTFAVLRSGFTTVAATESVPEPHSPLLLVLALAVMLAIRRVGDRAARRVPLPHRD